VPGFVDTHTHLVFAGDRAAEFASRMAGVAYDGGGIATTVDATRAASDEVLRALLAGRMAELRSQGTTTTEIKSGYGLTVVDEERLLRLARECHRRDHVPRAHVVPPGAQRAAYIELVTGEMLTACAPEARWIDVFCEPASPHAFDGDEARTVLEAGRDAGLGLRVHGNQLSAGPGCGSPSSSARPASTTAPSWSPPTSTRWRAVRRWPPSCPASSSPRARVTPRPGCCSTPE